MRIRENMILDTDSYKCSHPDQYQDGTQGLFDVLLSRGGRYGQTMPVGLQQLLLDYFTTPITYDDIVEAEVFLPQHMGITLNKEAWKRVLTVHHGFLPLRIRAVAEGSLVPTQNVLMTVESTDPELFWLPGWYEPKFMRLWSPHTVATQGYFIKRTILEALLESADDPWGEIGGKLHDFGSRGVTSRESAGIGGMAHLVNFEGSDNIEGIRYANHYYKAEMAGNSIPAAEHATVSSRGRAGELEFYRSFVKRFLKPGAVAACVSDTYDIYNAVQNFWGEELREQVKASGGTLVIRPDSGVPVEVVLKCLRILEDKVGMRQNLKGFKVLPRYFRIIQGDGVNHDSIREILAEMLKNKYSASNISFGAGGALLQKLDRDTQSYAYKATEITVNGTSMPIFKDPVTDPSKRSRGGRLDLIFTNGEFKTVEGEMPHLSCLETIYENGKILKEVTFDQVRARADSYLKSPVRAI
jgi:nicotinamide phosphoribosyltransferase